MRQNEYLVIQNGVETDQWLLRNFSNQQNIISEGIKTLNQHRLGWKGCIPQSTKKTARWIGGWKKTFILTSAQFEHPDYLPGKTGELAKNVRQFMSGDGGMSVYPPSLSLCHCW